MAEAAFGFNKDESYSLKPMMPVMARIFFAF